MFNARRHGLGAAVTLAAGILIAFAPGVEAKDPPACQAISFRPLVPGGPDTDMEAGMSAGRKVVLMATVRNGQPVHYFMVLNGQRPSALETRIAPGSESCLKSKNVKVPFKTQADHCTGDRFRVVIYKSGKDKTAMLFGLIGEEWEFCNAARM